MGDDGVLSWLLFHATLGRAALPLPALGAIQGEYSRRWPANYSSKLRILGRSYQNVVD